MLLITVRRAEATKAQGISASVSTSKSDVWDTKNRQAIGNLQKLDWLCILPQIHLVMITKMRDFTQPSLENTKAYLLMCTTEDNTSPPLKMKMKMKVHVLSVAQKMFIHSSVQWASTITRFEGGDMIPEEYMMHCKGWYW
jgi:hypothetical protein